MKLIFSLDYQHCLLIPTEHQAAFLTILNASKVYKGDSYPESYHPSDKLPEIKFVSENLLHGYKEAMEKAQKDADDERSQKYKAQVEKSNLTAQLAELQKKFDDLNSLPTIDTDILEDKEDE